MWKTTDRYVQQKRVKAVEAESKLKQVYIPNYAKPNATSGLANATGGTAVPSGKTVMNGNSGPTASNGNNNDVITINGGKPCESCAETASPQVRNVGLSFKQVSKRIRFSSFVQWYAWGPTHLCQTCWTYWKKYGGLKVASSRVASADNEIELLKKKAAITTTPITISDTDDGIALSDLSTRPPHRYIPLLLIRC